MLFIQKERTVTDGMWSFHAYVAQAGVFGVGE
jgi:hypothetical protein